MSALKQFRKMVFLILGALALAVGCWAQDTQEPQEQPDTATKPKPAARGIPGITDPNATVDENENQPTHWQPDTSPATGLSSPTLGTPEVAHSYWVPGLIVGSTIQSQPPGQQVSSGWYANTY